MASVDEVIRWHERMARGEFGPLRGQFEAFASALREMQEERDRLRDAIWGELFEHEDEAELNRRDKFGDVDEAAYHEKRAAILRRALSIQYSPEGQANV